MSTQPASTGLQPCEPVRAPTVINWEVQRRELFRGGRDIPSGGDIRRVAARAIHEDLHIMTVEQILRFVKPAHAEAMVEAYLKDLNEDAQWKREYFSRAMQLLQSMRARGAFQTPGGVGKDTKGEKEGEWTLVTWLPVPSSERAHTSEGRAMEQSSAHRAERAAEEGKANGSSREPALDRHPEQPDLDLEAQQQPLRDDAARPQSSTNWLSGLLNTSVSKTDARDHERGSSKDYGSGEPKGKPDEVHDAKRPHVKPAKETRDANLGDWVEVEDGMSVD